jgi:hypothetical protein
MTLKPFLKLEFLYLFLIPTLIAAFVFIKSIIILSTKINLTNWILTLTILILIIFSEYILYVVFFKNAWPTYLPNIAIGISLILYMIQFYTNKNTCY